MPLFGSHLSVAGGYYKAADAAAALGMDTVQIFTKNNNQWQAKPITDEDILLFREAVARGNLRKPCAHNSYLINVASAKDELWQKSLAAMVIEVERAEALGLEGVVMHPGSPVDSTEADGLSRIVTALDEVHRQTAGVHVKIWLETTAGQGSCLGHRFEHLQHILEQVATPERLGVCVDTCHIFAAGYPLATADEYRSTMQQFEDHIGIERICAFHLNDSKKPFGSRVDRHEHIGEGCLGLEPFRHVVNDPRFAEIPMYLETEKGDRDGEELDAINLRTLKGLMA
jgi:deoxyribonuclease IV